MHTPHQPSATTKGTAPDDQVHRPAWLDPATYPFSLRSAQLATGSVTYIDEGSGPTLLFVHAGMWSFIFRDVIERLSPGFRCLTLDLPGNGLTPDHDAVGDLAAASHLLGEFVELLDLRDITLIVHDLGGLVGLGAAAAHPDRYRGLVVANSFAWTPDTRGLRTMLKVMGSRPVTAFDAATNLIPKLSSGKAGVGRHLDASGRAAFLGPFRAKGPRRAFHRMMRSAITGRELSERVAAATTGRLNHLPVLSIYGERNDPFGFQDRIARIWPDHEGVVVEGGNHFPMMDDPDLFSATVRDWHRRTAG